MDSGRLGGGTQWSLKAGAGPQCCGDNSEVETCLCFRSPIPLSSLYPQPQTAALWEPMMQLELLRGGRAIKPWVNLTIANWCAMWRGSQHTWDMETQRNKGLSQIWV